MTPSRPEPPREILFSPALLLVLVLYCLTSCADPKVVEGVPGVGNVGEVCAPDGAFVCEGSDKNAERELICTDGVLAPYAECAEGCWVVVDLMGEREVACVQPTLVTPAPAEDAGTLEDSGGNQILPPDISQDGSI